MEQCTRCRVLGLTVTMAGGDGIEVVQSKDVHIKDVMLDNNYRNGISIVGATDMLVEHSIFSNTGQGAGTSPMNAVDIEPDPGGMESEPSVNVTFRHCTAVNNLGGGYEVSVKYNDATTYAAPRRPMSILFDNCSVLRTGDGTDRGCYSGHGYEIGGPKVGVRGSITIINAVIEGTATAGIMLINTAPSGGSAIGNVSITFENVTLRNTATQKQCTITDTSAYVHTQACLKQPRNTMCTENVTTAPIMTNLIVDPGYDCCAGTFRNVSVVDVLERPFLFMDTLHPCRANAPCHVRASNMISGDVTVSNTNHRPRPRQIGCKVAGPGGTILDPPLSLSVSCTNMQATTAT
jgi:hypothetical protein